ncbi:MAG TPA: hypothetical protein VND87_13620 [Stellaceae bacterium]|nr:hypothetical protein [Stellaceae bacterium]
MRFSSIVVLLGAGAAGAYAAVNPARVIDRAVNFYESIYPSDPHEEQALAMCFSGDHTFNRADPVERAACYRRILGAAPQDNQGQPTQRVARSNFIDLWRASGQGYLPQNDVREHEEDNYYLGRVASTRPR